MIVRTLGLVAVFATLAACQPSTEKAGADAPVGAEAAVPAARLEALKAQVLTLVKADENCVLPDFMESERTVEGVDLGGGAAGVLVVCSTGTADQWSRIYVAKGDGAPELVRLPLYKFQGADGWVTWDSMSNMSWDPATKVFGGAARTQATGCADGGDWRWDGERLVLVRQWSIDCSAAGADDQLPDPVDNFPTTPPTVQPAVIAPQA